MAQNELIYPRPERSDYNIGIIGAGGIVNHAHLPAYRKAGLNVVAICDVREDAVKATADRWNIASTYADFRHLLERTDIHIVDIAIPNEGRTEIVKAAADAGKHVLIQKPFAHRCDDAVEMVKYCERAGVKLAVNQNARFAPVYREVKKILEQGVLGEPYLFTHEMRINQDATMANTWFARIPHFLLVDYEIHHIDLMRYWCGVTPNRIYTSTTRMQGQQFASDMISLIVMEFQQGARATLTSVDTTQSPDYFWRFTVEGTKGSLIGTIMRDYKNPRVEYFTHASGVWTRPVITGDWFPDAFYGTMFELMSSIYEYREPMISGRDNLETLQVLNAAILSSETRQVVEVTTT